MQGEDEPAKGEGSRKPVGSRLCSLGWSFLWSGDWNGCWCARGELKNREESEGKTGLIVPSGTFIYDRPNCVRVISTLKYCLYR